MTNAWRSALLEGIADRYRFRHELGGGGMSATFVVDEIALGRTVVLKALPPEMADGLSADRFVREIQTAARLQHPFLVPLLAAGMTEGTPWYTMPLVQGESLRTRLEREGPMAAPAVAHILRDVAEALAYAHGNGVVHRDIKPDNVLLSGAHAVVTDFGVAKALAASTANSTMTGVGVALGTPAYMAPEQAAADSAMDHRVDLYALGAMAWEMLAGRPIFGARNAAQLLVAHAVEAPAEIATVAATTPPELAALVHRLLAKDPNERPAAAGEVANALAAMLTRWASVGTPATNRAGRAERRAVVRAIGIWSAAFVGVVIAAWAAVRWLPVPEWTLPAAVIAMIAGLPAIGAAAWFGVDWRHVRRGGYAAVGLVALLATALGAMRSFGIGPNAPLTGVVTTADRVLIADFDSPANDSTLGQIIAETLPLELARSPSIHLVTSGGRANALASMKLPRSSRVDRALAPQVAARANAKVYLTGSIVPRGNGYAIHATLVAAANDSLLAAFDRTASSPDDVISAIDKLGRDIRSRLVSSLREVRGADRLAYAVTPSFAALRHYTQGIQAGENGQFPAAMRQLELAVAADTEFAMAYRLLSSYAANVDNAGREAWASERAYRYRDKLSATNQALVEGNYFRGPAGFDRGKNLAADQRAVDLSPRSATSHNNFAVDLIDARDPVRALEQWMLGVQTDTTSVFSPQSPPEAYLAEGFPDSAWRYVHERLIRWQPRNPATVLTQANLLIAAHDVDSAAALVDARLRADSAVRRAGGAMEKYDGLLSLVQGRIGSAEQALEIGFPRTADTADAIGPRNLDRAETLILLLGDVRAGRALLDSITTRNPPGALSAVDYPRLQLATLYAMAGAPDRANELLHGYERVATPANAAYDQGLLGTARASIAMAERRYPDAIVAARSADVGSCRVCALPYLARAYDLSGNADSAIAVYRRFLDIPDAFRLPADAFFLASTYQRLGELYAARGDNRNAAAYYERLVHLWMHADPALQPRVTEMRQRIARLVPGG